MRGYIVISIAIVCGLLGVSGAGCGGKSATPPSNLTYSTNPAGYLLGSAILPNVPSTSGGAVASYSVNPALPDGLSLDITTGIISGTPTAVRPIASYIITAKNSGGSATANLRITVFDTASQLTVLAGMPSGFGNVDGTGSAARFNDPHGVAVDSSGNVYVADTTNHIIRTITPAGVVSTFAGMAGQSGSANGTGAEARFNGPYGVAVDGSIPANVYVADTGNNTIRMITSAGVVSTLAGAADQPHGTADGTGADARFWNPYGVTVDGSGNVYVADTGNHTIRMITSAGVVSTLAGTGQGAPFLHPSAVAVDSSGNVYVADTGNHIIRKVTTTPTVAISILAGTGDGAPFSHPNGLALDVSGNVYVADTGNHTIRMVTSAGAVSTLAGTVGEDGSADGTGADARFSGPYGVAVDGSGNVYVADTGNRTIRKVTSAAEVSTLAGTASEDGSTNGAGADARFYKPQGVAVDSSGNVYVADTENHTIRKITQDGVVSTLAGTAGEYGSVDATGADARFYFPLGMAVDGSENVYVADSWNNTIRKITPDGVVSTLAGTAGEYGSIDATGADARFDYPSSVAVDSSGNVYVADTVNNTIRKITPDGAVSTLAGTADLPPGSDDGTGAAARFNGPLGVAVDSSGNIYVADTENHTIRKVTSAGEVSTLAGTAGEYGSVDATGADARFDYPLGVTVDGCGNIYVVDFNNLTIRMITPARVVSTVVGVPGRVGSVPGPLPASLYNPWGVAFDATSGSLIIVVDHAVLKVD